MRLSFCRLERFERHAISRSDLLLDISADDLGHWHHPRGRCLPPLPAPLSELPQGGLSDGVLFLGNLQTPNNLAGLRLLLDDVMPRVWREQPGLPVHVVGSGPGAETERWITARGARLHKNVADPMAWLMGAGCIVNPVRDGSGVQLKTLDMLQTDRPILSFAQGLRGLPAQARAAVRLVATPAELAEAIVALQREGFPAATGRAAVRALFDERAFQRALAEVLP